MPHVTASRTSRLARDRRAHVGGASSPLSASPSHPSSLSALEEASDSSEAPPSIAASTGCSVRTASVACSYSGM